MMHGIFLHRFPWHRLPETNSMHTPFLLTAVLSTLGPPLDAPVSARLEAGAALTPSICRHEASYLLDTQFPDDDEEGSRVGRVFAEYLVGLGTGATALALGGLAFSEAPPIVWGAATLSMQALGTSVGVAFMGSAMEGRGGFGYTLLGSILGIAIPLAGGTALMLAEDCQLSDDFDGCSAMGPTVAGLLLLPAVGATLGYELSSPTPWLSLASSRGTPAPAPRVVPVLAPARQGLGGTIGIAGRL